MRMKRVSRAAKNAMATAAPTAIPAIAPVGREDEDFVASVYFRVNCWEVITLTEALEEGLEVGAARGLEGEVKQGVSPAIVEAYIDQPLGFC